MMQLKLISFDAKESMEVSDLPALDKLLVNLQNFDQDSQATLVDDLRTRGFPVAEPFIARMLDRKEIEKITLWLMPSAKTKEDQEFLVQSARIGFDQAIGLFAGMLDSEIIVQQKNLPELINIARKALLLMEGREITEVGRQLLDTLNTKIGERIAQEESEIVGYSLAECLENFQMAGYLVPLLKVLKGDNLEKVLRAYGDSRKSYSLSWLEDLDAAGVLEQFFDLVFDQEGDLTELFSKAVGDPSHRDFLDDFIQNSSEMAELNSSCSSMLRRLFAIADQRGIQDWAIRAAVVVAEQGAQFARIIMALDEDYPKFFEVVGFETGWNLGALIGRLLKPFWAQFPLPGEKEEAMAGLRVLCVAAQKTNNLDLLLSAAKEDGVLEKLLAKTKEMKKKPESSKTMFDEIQKAVVDGKLSSEIAGEILLFS
ncbi:MAG: hypothetical protein HQ564_00550 [Candidatus Saganbacteria bacterium]|nr:hypothetical protein [Candidatus Saganbacteria bacterium]